MFSYKNYKYSFRKLQSLIIARPVENFLPSENEIACNTRNNRRQRSECYKYPSNICRLSHKVVTGRDTYQNKYSNVYGNRIDGRYSWKTIE